MRTFVRLLSILAPTLILGPRDIGSQQEPEPTAFIDEVKKDILEKIEKFLEKQEWKSLFDTYDSAIAKHGHKLVRPDSSKEVWIGLVEHLQRRFSGLPPAALEFYRGENDGKAQAAHSRAKEEGDRAALIGIVDRYFYASITDDLLDSIGNAAFEDRKNDQAIHFWRRLLEHYPDSSIPRHATAAKIAMAACVSGNLPALEWVRRTVEQRGLAGDLIVAGKPVTLAAYLSTLSIETSVMANAAIAPPPMIPEAEGRFRRRGTGVRNDIRRWSFDFSADPSATPTPMPGRRIIIGGQAPVAGVKDYPFFPGYGVVRGHPVVVMTDGRQVTAVDPQKVASSAPRGGIYWRSPDQPIRRSTAAERNLGINSPQVGVAVEGELCYATMYSEKRAGPDPNQMDLFDGPARLVCHQTLSGKIVWDTDTEKLHPAWRKLDFYSRNWAFAAPPLVRGNLLYAAICSSPVGEVECRVVCLDRFTGELRWNTFVASVQGQQNRMGGFFPLIPQLIEQGGTLYVQSNLGVVAAIGAIGGQVRWLTSYGHRFPGRNPFTGVAGIEVMRPPEPPLFHRGRVYALPQDQGDLQVFDAMTGDKIDWIPRSSAGDEIVWKNVTRLIGIADDWLIAGGTPGSIVINLVDRKNDKGEVKTEAGRAWPININMQGCGRGVIQNDLIYLPSADTTGRSLFVYTVGTFRRIFSARWKDDRDHGNLVLAGNHLVVAGDRGVSIYTDSETLKSEFVRRLEQSPPDPQARLDYADLMRENDQLAEASESYQIFIRLADGDPRFAERSRQVKTELYDIFMKRGLLSSSGTNPPAGQREAAAEYFGTAQRFAYDEDTFAESTRRLAETYEALAAGHKDAEEKIRLATRAVEEHQAVIDRARRAMIRIDGSEVSRKAWVHASGRIAALEKLHGAEVLGPVARRAKAALAAAEQKGGTEALRQVAAEFPRSPAAWEALRRLAGDYAKSKDWIRGVATWKELRAGFPDRWGIDHHCRLVEALEQRGDWVRVRDEARLLEAQHGTAKVPGETSLTAKDYADRAVKRALESTPPAPPPLADAPRQVAVFEPGSTPDHPFQIPTAPVPLEGLGTAPREFTDGHELIARGSSVELWNLRNGQKLWTAAHPGAYIGLFLSLTPIDAGVEVMEVVPDAPAAKGGLRPGDQMLSVNGQPLTLANFSSRVDQAGAKLVFSVKREESALDVTVAPVPWPAAHKPRVLKAFFTSAYAVGVAWEDLVAAYDFATGRMLWSAACMDPLSAFVDAYVIEGRVLLHEHRRSGITSPPLQPGVPGRPETLCRLVCFDDVTGDAAWVRGLHASGAGEAHDLELVSPLLEKSGIVLLNRVGRNVVNSLSPLFLSAADGSDARASQLQINSVLCYAVDAERGVMHYVERDYQLLKSIQLWPRPDTAGQVKLLEQVPLGKYVPGGFQQAGIAAGSRHVVVTVPPSAATQGQKIVVFSLATGKEWTTLPIPEDRTLPHSRTDLVKLDDDGMCYVLLLPRGPASAGGPARGGILTAFRILEKPNADGALAEIAWEAVAPNIGGGAQGRDAFIDSTGGCVVLFTQRGLMPAETTGQPLALVYSKRDGGYIRRCFENLLDEGADPDRFPVSVSRGRIYVSAKNGLTIWGN